MKRNEWIVAGLAVVVVAAGAVLLRERRRRTLSAVDRRFLLLAAQSLQGPLALSRLAPGRASEAAIAGLAAELLVGYTRLHNELRLLAALKAVELPGVPGVAARSDAARLQELQGAAFDRAYVDAVVAAQLQAVSALRLAIDEGNEREVVAFARRALPMVQEHLTQARSVSANTPRRSLP